MPTALPTVPPLLAASAVKAAARLLGFAACGLAPAAPISHARRAWREESLGRGYQAGMDYLARNLEKRADPRLLVEGARTVVSVALAYCPPTPVPGMARYAAGRDYHDVMKALLHALMRTIGMAPAEGRAFCDTAPIDERYWAWRAGLGWIGRNTQLILPRAGSYFFLGEIVTTRPADAYDAPIAPRCGRCHACIDACPARALTPDGHLDARRCLSYLTIEHRGSLPAGTASQLQGSFYGCDRCAEVCPHNRLATPTTNPAFAPSEALMAMTPQQWRELTPEQWRELFKGSAVKRAQYEGLTRNIAACFGPGPTRKP